jgi:hypothetical protein
MSPVQRTAPEGLENPPKKEHQNEFLFKKEGAM